MPPPVFPTHPPPQLHPPVVAAQPGRLPWAQLAGAIGVGQPAAALGHGHAPPVLQQLPRGAPAPCGRRGREHPWVPRAGLHRGEGHLCAVGGTAAMGEVGQGPFYGAGSSYGAGLSYGDIPGSQGPCRHSTWGQRSAQPRGHPLAQAAKTRPRSSHDSPGRREGVRTCRGAAGLVGEVPRAPGRVLPGHAAAAQLWLWTWAPRQCRALAGCRGWRRRRRDPPAQGARQRPQGPQGLQRQGSAGHRHHLRARESPPGSPCHPWVPRQI